MGRSSVTEGVPSGITTQTGTGSSFAVLPSSYNLPDNYFKGWIAVNTTRNESSRVISYNNATRIAEISPQISSQTAGDKIYFLSDQEQVFVYPVPEKKYRFAIRYYRICPELSADSDIPVVDRGNDSSFLIDFALAEAFLSDKKPDMASVCRQKFYNTLDNIKQRDVFTPDRAYNFRRRR
jgi:hypothetical protein